MKNITFKILFLLFALVGLLSVGLVAFAYQSPTANAGPDLYVNSGQTVTLQGSGFDPQSSNLAYYWNCSGGTLSNASVAQPIFTAPNNNSQSYNCSLTATNGYSLSSSDTMIVYVNSGQIGGASVQTNSATYVSNNQATLNGTLSIPYITSGINYVWFQWGTDTNYGNNTFQQSLNYSGPFFQLIANLSSNITYHFRAVAQTGGYTIYGQDMAFNSNGSNNYYGNSSLTITKQVVNLSSGSQNWQASVNGYPGDVLGFAIIIRAGNQDAHNVTVRDILPANLIYGGNLTLNASPNNVGSLSSGINVGTIPANGLAVIGYQAQVASATNFVYGTTTLSNSATVLSSETGIQTASASVIVNTQSVLGATAVSTGLTNNFLTDSFFFPLLLIVLSAWLYFSGNIYIFSDWVKKHI